MHIAAKPQTPHFIKVKNRGKATLYIPIPKSVVAAYGLWMVVKHGVPNSKQPLTLTLTDGLKIGMNKVGGLQRSCPPEPVNPKFLGMESVQLAIVFSARAVSSTSKEGTLYFTSVWNFGGKGLYQISLSCALVT